MRKNILILMSIVVSSFAIAAFTLSYAKYLDAEKEVSQLVTRSYIHGAFNELNPEAMQKGFHEDFAIFSANGETLERYEIEDWVAGVEKRKADPEFDPSSNVWTHKFSNLDVSGNAASLKVDLYKDGKHVYTDYLSLLKFESGWKIVAKVYQRHQ